ncbi:MAG TPA: hypothetical protein HPP56_08105 [Nitrospirae bacterium]|nr:hypothetical protein [Nitrospirota bacterium]
MRDINEYFVKALQSYKQKDYEEVEFIIEKILNMDNQFEKAIFLKGVILYEKGKIKEADKLFQTFTNLSVWWLRLGLELEKTDEERAINCYNKALSINPTDNYTLLKKGLLMEKKGNYSESTKCFKAINPMRELLSRVIIPFGFMCLLSVGAFMLISKGENGLSFVVIISAIFCLSWLKRDAGNVLKMIYKKSLLSRFIFLA